MDPPGQPWRRRLCRRFWGFPPFLALVEAIALAVHLQNMDMVAGVRQAYRVAMDVAMDADPPFGSYLPK
jgi:hypothetical protein